MKIAFIGGGVMGEAMLSAILEKGLSTSQDIWVSDISETRRQNLEQGYGVTVASNNQLVAEKGEVVVLAIKPHNLIEVMAEITLKPAQLVLSIITGARINTLCRGLNHSSVVRAMPNTPAQIGEGVSVWTATTEVTEQQKGWATSILSAMGKQVYINDEKYIDMATAVSGSGPAYFFLFVESLAEAAVNIGLPYEIAQELVLPTLLGSGHLIQKSGKPPAELRGMVTTPGGTTSEALSQFEKGGFTGLVKEAVNAAYEKARSLGA